VVEDTKETEYRVPGTPLVCSDQMTPPSIVYRILPLAPTIQPFVVLANDTSRRVVVTGLVCAVQVEPPFDVWRIFPLDPTAQPVKESKKWIP
jgi:hypothetical protein